MPAPYRLAGHYAEPLLDPFGNGLPGASVAFYVVGTSTFATLYRDATKAATAANPVTSAGVGSTIDSLGNLTVFADPGFYDMVTTVGTRAGPRVLVKVDLDPAEAAQVDARGKLLPAQSGTFATTVDDATGDSATPFRVATTSHPTGPAKARVASTKFSGEGSTFYDPQLSIGFLNEGGEATNAIIFEQDYWTATGFSKRVTTKALTANVATLTTKRPHLFTVGQHLVVSGIDATFNGTYVIKAVPSPTTVTYDRVAADVLSSATDGNVSVWHHQAEQHSVFIAAGGKQSRLFSWSGEYATQEVALSFSADYFDVYDATSGLPLLAVSPGEPFSFYRDIHFPQGKGLLGEVTVKGHALVIDGAQSPIPGLTGTELRLAAAAGSPNSLKFLQGATETWRWWDQGGGGLFLRDVVRARNVLSMNSHPSPEWRAFRISGHTEVIVETNQGVDAFAVVTPNLTPLWGLTAAGIPKWHAAANQQTTVGAAGGAAALPATPTKYLKVVDSAGITLVIPAYAAA